MRENLSQPVISNMKNKEEMPTNNIDKKTETKRLFIYLILSFGLTWLLFFAMIFTGFQWDGSKPNMEQFIGLGMLMPFAAHLLTRWITREGFAMTGKDSVMLGIRLRDKKWKYYLFALLIPWVYFEITHALMLLLVPKAFDTSVLVEQGYSKGIAYVYPFITIVYCAITSFAALGEEGGWRGYMMPKLMKLMSAPRAILVGGIIWGLWHAPLTCVGHNFGTDYPGFPYVGILIMCVQCILLGAILTYITMKTQSVWPAAIMHAVNNGTPTALGLFVNQDVWNERFPSPIYSFLLMMIPMLLIVLSIIWKEMKNKKEKE